MEKDRKIQLQHGLSVEIYGFDVAGMRIICYLHASKVFIESSRFISDLVSISLAAFFFTASQSLTCSVTS